MIVKQLFGKIDNHEVYLYTISNKNKMSASICDFGATLINLIVNGVDVVLGYKDINCYIDNGEFIGCVVAPNGNRIANGKCVIDGKTYQLDINNGPNNLHTHFEYGASKHFMKVEEKENELVFSAHFKDALANLPGNRDFSVSYKLTDEDELVVTYQMISDKKTIFNPTQHSYFNLNGHNSGKIFDQYLKLNCDNFTPVNENMIPTGEIRNVKDTIFDFREYKKIGQDFDLNDQQFKITMGYDHNFVINNYDGSLKEIGRLLSKENNLEMICLTTQPAVQIYSANYLERNDGKENTIYHKYDGICLETQFYPDCINHPNFPSSVIDADKQVTYQTVFKFKKKPVQ